jgi:AcrR family transcriptional regulator
MIAKEGNRPSGGRRSDRVSVQELKRQETRAALLQAAERILVTEGIHALTVRHIGAVSGQAPTSITYHFGTIAGLLSELCSLNLDPMLEDWKAIEERHFDRIEDVLRAWMTPLMRPAACHTNGRALIVLDEIASHGDAVMQDRLLKPMLALSVKVQEALRPYVPHLDSRSLRARVRFLSAATLGPPPRTRAISIKQGERPLDSVDYLIDFAVASLMYCPEE